ncbi:MAG: dihydropteroate synthase [Microcoleus sp. PH2017_10_PVI_O_A]|uniref:dihydropteroate synthase n=1 Tax=unclassified Microcoleus TaxID=2642155 RepID=UPI001DCFCCEA|nr:MULTISPECIES: dihydropteroate synthase [unclassified Microcoleus]TAE79438.1 MAG: dihydropteroate synthase [Oscillatoriales cyanobacterium]MCC3408268.1 dihydropteroate synthase [Microcoleus sp. PH2017_10_PVI_O_A]MCC3461640.1 dihydropteroate synthase [Microcoleus sp. PH2017_11_PCY_U_A]MCC3480818.1 dihydropteroate synthase [Microcoleus sp. PH2017_12_PCY_D_A]MCC3528939.1 dihydropteroate synthase [Microcoleus sp. PH2017_21_RUC_O_A]
MTDNPAKIIIRNKTFEWGKRTYLMGVLNVTPDSFSDGGDFNTIEAALAQAENMVKSGVDIIDIGGQSTRPGAAEISLEEEIDRVIPVVQMLREKADIFASVPISVDTTRAQVASSAVEAGADIINDISGATFDSEMLSTVAQLQVPIILMHVRGTPQTMQKLTDYQDLIGEILDFLESRIVAAVAAGIDKSQIIIDPGIGFAKTYSQNLEILRQLPKFRGLDCPILVGVSRKSFIGHILNQPEAKQRIWGTAAACTGAIANSADILRVHDVREMHDVCLVADAIFRNQS